jgi:DNA mismatch repair ATPase MutS
MRENLEKITPYKLSIQKVGELGHVLQCFYQMHTNIEFDETLLYSFGYHGFIDNLQGISQNSGLNHAKFIDKKKRHKAKCKKMYYPSLIGQNKDKDKDTNKIVKNDFTFKRNSIITGPNASGKTTILKSTLINIILTQQMGVGFYEKALFAPFKHIHCYLNIPDTSGRDSLFQAEARRCKEILDIVMKNKNDTHFCAFDELYSGTNPEEAVMSALAFMKYLMKYKNTSVVLTTHFHHLCDCLDKDEKIENLHMEIEKGETDDFVYKYALKKGISRVRGGIKVLYDMEYPEEIIENTKKEMMMEKEN